MNKPKQLPFQKELKSVCFTKAKHCGPVDFYCSYSTIIYWSLCLDQLCPTEIPVVTEMF